MPADPQRVKDLFAAALDLPDPQARRDLLDRECAADPDLRRRLDVLLHANDHPDAALQQPFAGAGTVEYGGPAEVVGTVVAGRYKLLEAIGEGGMGAVWMAEQREPVKRLVALKLIKPGMDSRSVLARFEAERQALALMDHPNIAKVHDGGTTEQGRPYFVMELVKGLPLTEYCDARRLSVGDRLELFGLVCSAVQHAHQKGVIHRDLKPSNVLVTEHDGKPVPKVIDFGLAKALGATNVLTDKTLHTAFGAVVGTPLYMAPEQVGINALDVDTRTDIYALGVILYELLTGSTPLEKKRLREAAWDEMRRLIREEEPPRPSARLSSSATLPSLAAGRQIEPARLTKLVRGELDWIVMKALEKDRNRRYETANGLAADVHRHLTGEPVLAVPPSAGYRLRKFARKHRAGLTTAAALGLLLVAGAAVSTWQAVRATRAEAAAGAERDRADEEKQIAQAVTEFLQNDLLRQTDTRHQLVNYDQPNRNPNITVRELLDRAAKTVDAKFKDQPLVEAAIRYTLADTYLGMGDAALGLSHARRAVALREANLGPVHLDTLAAKTILGHILVNRRQPAYAGGSQDAGPEAESLLKEVVSVYEVKLGADNTETLKAKFGLVIVYGAQNKFEQAVPLCKEVALRMRSVFGDNHVAYLVPMVYLGWLYFHQGNDDKAESQFNEFFATPFGKDWRNLVDGRHAANGLFAVYWRKGNHELAEHWLKELLAARITAYGVDHNEVLYAKNDLAELYLTLRKQELAEPLFRELTDVARKKDGLDSPMYTFRLANLGRCLLQCEKWTDAETTLRECLAIRERTMPDDWRTYHAKSLLGGALLGQKKYADAEPLLLVGYEGMKQPPSVFMMRLPEALERLVQLYEATGRPDEAAKWRTVLEARKSQSPPK